MKRYLIVIASTLLCALIITAIFISVGAENGIAGDVNRDEKTNNKDVVALFRYLNGGEIADIDIIACDTNGDGEINNKDVVVLFRHVSDPDYKIFYGKPGAEETSDTETTLDFEETTDISGHVHTIDCYLKDWEFNGDYHWHEMICNEGDLLFNSTLNKHTWDENHKCSVCNYVEMHSVTFVDYDNSIITSELVEWGTEYKNVEKPNNPDHDGLTFTGWGNVPDKITYDLILTAQYDEILPKISFVFVDTDNKLKTVEQTVAYGSIPIPPDADEVAEYKFDWQSYKAYAFSHWDPNLKPATENITYTAQYKETYERPIIAVNFANIDELNHTFNVFITLCNIKRNDRRLYMYNFTLTTSSEGKTYDVADKDGVEFNTAGGWITTGEIKNYAWEWNRKSHKLSIGWSTQNLTAEQNGTLLTNDYENIITIHFSAMGPIDIHDIRISPETCRLILSDDGGETMQSVQPIIIYRYN